MSKVLPKCCNCRWFKFGTMGILTGLSLDARCGGQAYQPAKAVFNNRYCRNIYEPIDEEITEEEKDEQS